MAILGLLGAGLGLAGGLLGAQQQRSSQASANREAAKLAAWENETNLINWEYSKDIRDYQYKESLKIFDRSKSIYKQNLQFNNLAAARSYEAENRKMDEYLKELAFTKQDQFVSLLKEQGAARARLQTGQSSTLRTQDPLSQWGRNNAILAESLVSAVKQHTSDLQSIDIQKQGADLDAYARLGLKPKKPPTPPKPTKKPAAGGSTNPLLSIGSSVIGAASTLAQANNW